MSLDRQRIQRAFAHAAAGYEAVAVLQQQVGDVLLERLELLTSAPARILDVGAGTGRISGLLRKRFPKSEVIALDLVPAMLKVAKRHSSWWRPFARIAGDAQDLPIASASIDLIVSNLCLPWCTDLKRVLNEFRRVLRPGGWLFLSTAGPDTLKELRAAWATVDQGAHVHLFLDMHDIGNALLSQGFSDPMLDVESYTLTYPDLNKLLRELQQCGATNALVERSRGLRGRHSFAAFTAAYARSTVDGRWPASVEVIFGQAQAPSAGQPLKSEGGDLASFSLAEMKSRLKSR